MSFESYTGTFRLATGFKRDGSNDYFLMQASDIQATEDMQSLEDVLSDLQNRTDPIKLDEELEEQAALIAQIKAKLRAKISGGGGIVDIKTETSEDGLVTTYTFIFADETEFEFSVTNGKSAYAYAVDAGYTGTEESFAAQLTGTSMVGSWTFIDEPDLTALPDEPAEISFISNGTEYSAIKRDIVGPSNLSIYGMYYGDRAVYVNSPDENDGITHGWSIDAYKTITITKEIADSSIVAWIKENAEMVGTPSKRLKTRSKRVVDAINELKDELDKTDEIGVEQIKCIDTWASGVRELYADNGIYWSEGFELYNQPELTGDVVASGDITHRVPIVPGENVTFEVDAENQVVKINAKGGGSGNSSNTFIDITSIPTQNINENAFYRYTENIKKFYAVTTTSRNIVDNDGQIMTVEVKDVETLPTVAAAEAVTNLTSKITLYYQHSDGKVYGAINNVILAAALGVSKQGWYEPTYAIKNYAGVIDSVLDAEYGYVYVVREIETKIHILYYKNGTWHETINDYLPRLGEVSREKFESTPNEDVNVSGYRSISNDYDRVYVESAGNSGASGVKQ